MNLRTPHIFFCFYWFAVNPVENLECSFFYYTYIKVRKRTSAITERNWRVNPKVYYLKQPCIVDHKVCYCHTKTLVSTIDIYQSALVDRSHEFVICELSRNIKCAVTAKQMANVGFFRTLLLWFVCKRSGLRNVCECEMNISFKLTASWTAECICNTLNPVKRFCCGVFVV